VFGRVVLCLCWQPVQPTGTVCCRLLQSVADCCSMLQHVAVWCSLVQSVAVCCSLLQSVATYRLTHDAWQVRDRLNTAESQTSQLALLLQSKNEELETVLARTRRVTDAGEDLQCVAVCCSVLQCVAVFDVCCSVILETVLAQTRRVADASEKMQRVAVCCSVLQCVAVCCSVLQSVAVSYSRLCSRELVASPMRVGGCSLLQYVTLCCNALQCVAICCSVLQCGAVRRSVLPCVAVCCNVLQ